MSKILMVNKFLFPNGGSETYCFKLVSYLKEQGHEVQFFGMEDSRNIVGNQLGLYVSNSEFKTMSISKILYPFKIIYSFEAKRKIRKVIDAFNPDVVHINNYNYQITPSILYGVKKRNIPIIMTLHDFQIVCPNHMMYLEHACKVCEECYNRRYTNCIKNKCIHNSKIKSLFAALEGYLYYKLGTYKKLIDLYISPSEFLKNKIVQFGEDKNKIVVLHNFISEMTSNCLSEKKEYVLYFGRLSIQKGINTLMQACKRMPNIRFVIAGSGDLEKEITGSNVDFVGFQSGDALRELIQSALFSIFPSEWYENCPMSVLESKMYGTPVVGSNIGGTPELIQDGVDGLLFEPGNIDDMVEKINTLYQDREMLKKFSINGVDNIKDFSIDKYYKKLMDIYSTAMKNEGWGR